MSNSTFVRELVQFGARLGRWQGREEDLLRALQVIDAGPPDATSPVTEPAAEVPAPEATQDPAAVTLAEAETVAETQTPAPTQDEVAEPALAAAERESLDAAAPVEVVAVEAVAELASVAIAEEVSVSIEEAVQEPAEAPADDVKAESPQASDAEAPTATGFTEERSGVRGEAIPEAAEQAI